MTWRANTEGRCSFVSDGWCRFVGRDAEASLGDGWLQFVHPADRKRVARDATRQLATRRVFFMYYKLRHHSGLYAQVLVHAVPQVHPASGEFTGYWGDAIEYAREKPSEPARVLVFTPKRADVMLVPSAIEEIRAESM